MATRGCAPGAKALSFQPLNCRLPTPSAARANPRRQQPRANSLCGHLQTSFDRVPCRFARKPANCESFAPCKLQCTLVGIEYVARAFRALRHFDPCADTSPALACAHFIQSARNGCQACRACCARCGACDDGARRLRKQLRRLHQLLDMHHRTYSYVNPNLKLDHRSMVMLCAS